MLHTRFFKAVLLSFVVGALFAFTAQSAVAQGTGTIRGTVTQEGTTSPIQGVQIHVLGTRIVGITDEEGRFIRKYRWRGIRQKLF